MWVSYALAVAVSCILAAPAIAEDVSLVTLLRAQAFNRVFEDFDFYHVTIESDLSRADGIREVTAVASGKFLEYTRRVKAVFWLDGQRVVRGQILEEEGLPPCSAPSPVHRTPEL